jgi:hypothetical protein
MNMKHWFYDVAPFQRKSAADWVGPAAAGLGIGLAVGIGVGLLCAPATGEEARLRLREGASRVRDRAANLASRARHQLAGPTEQAGVVHS